MGNSYCVNLDKIASLNLVAATSIRALAFLHGYTEPLLLLLHETAPTWGGRWAGRHQAEQRIHAAALAQAALPPSLSTLAA